MLEPAPKLDPRTAKDIEEQVRQLLAQYLPATFRDPAGKARELAGTNRALVKIFARFTEILIQRLNQVPDKNFLAFLDLLGASQLPPQPARVPLTFFLAAGGTIDAIVPVGTQVAAPPAEGQTEPVIFETERTLIVTPTQLKAVFVCHLQQDQYSDWSQVTRSAIPDQVPIFQTNQSIEHIFYIGDDQLLSEPSLAEVSLKFTLAPLNLKSGEVLDARSLQWEIWDGKEGIPIQPQAVRLRSTPPVPRITDGTAGFTQDGTITIQVPNALPAQPVNGVSGPWLRCSLQTPITPATELQPGKIRVTHLPKINTLTIQTRLQYPASPIPTAIANQALIEDPTLPFYAFSERPKIGSTLYLQLADQAVFAANGTVTLSVVVNSAGVSPNTSIRLSWKYWNGQDWALVGNLQDSTTSFTVSAAAPNDTKQISFILNSPPQLTEVNGIAGIWLRIQISAGNYGSEPSFVPVLDAQGRQQVDATGNPLYKLVTTQFTPPLISVLSVAYDRPLSEAKLAKVLTYNNFIYPPIPSEGNFFPFQLTSDPLTQLETLPTVYLGFSLAPGQTQFPKNTFSLYFQMGDDRYDPTAVFSSPPTQGSLKLAWEYWNGAAWLSLPIQDQTNHLTRSGLVEFLLPADFTPRLEFATNAYWLRVRWEQGAYLIAPRLSRLLLNTTIALQTLTIRQELLGSSDGSASQLFHTTRIPVLEYPQLEVRELERPLASELAKLGEGAITETLDATGRPQAIWVRWREVSDFYGSAPRDRHYILNHLTGEIRFGNSLNGLIPPIGTGNLRLTYQTGGGIAGNQPAGTIVQLKTTIPYIDQVINLEPAAGGADAESVELMRDREPRKLRHNDRAVTLEDYEDLAMIASPAVARAKCTPLLNLLSNPTALPSRFDEAPKSPGFVSVIIVPRSSDVQPLPSLELISRVQTYLQAHSLPTVKITVVGPLYIQVSVTVEIALASLENTTTVEQMVDQQLTQFLHPLTGGFDRNGWAFGREPYPSDFYRLIEAIPGVDYIRRLTVDDGRTQADLQTQEKITAILNTKRFLVYSGKHRISLFFNNSP